MLKKLRKIRAFTLIELLIVISVIAVLVSIIAVSYSASQKRARDAKRLNDMTDIISALRAYKSANGHYPDTDINVYKFSYITDTATVPSADANKKWSDFSDKLTNFMDSVPIDPKNDSTYYYIYRYNGLANYNCNFFGKFVLVGFSKAEQDVNKGKEQATCEPKDISKPINIPSYDYSYFLPE